jgi:hypothetical protein
MESNLQKLPTERSYGKETSGILPFNFHPRPHHSKSKSPQLILQLFDPRMIGTLGENRLRGSKFTAEMVS